MKIKLNDEVLLAIADAIANREAHDWFESTGETPDVTGLYASAFLDGMLYIIERIENGDIS